MALMSFFIHLHHFGEAPLFEWAIKSKHEDALLLDAKNVWRRNDCTIFKVFLHLT